MSNKTTDAIEILNKLDRDNAELQRLLAEARHDSKVASLVYEARIAAGLTQKQLAERIGSHQSVIARLEDADYKGHSLHTISRIAQALGFELDIKLVRKDAESKTVKTTVHWVSVGPPAVSYRFNSNPVKGHGPSALGRNPSAQAA